MGLLNRFIGSTESIAKELVLDDEKIIGIWKDYLSTVSDKGAIIKALSPSNISQVDLQPVVKLIQRELVDIPTAEAEEEEIIRDLEFLEHSKKIKIIDRLRANKEDGLAWTKNQLNKPYFIRIKKPLQKIKQFFQKPEI